MTNFGIFENQPAHLLCDVLDRVPYNDLNSLSLSSKFWHSTIKKHVESTRFNKDILQSKNTFHIGKLIETISEPNDFKMIEQFLENRWENEKDYDALGDAIRGFCTNSGEEIKENVKKLFYFTWDLVEHLDVLVKNVDEEFYGNEVDELTAGRRRMELRRQLHSLFWKGADSQYKGFIFIQLLEKIEYLVGARLEKGFNFLKVLLNPTRINDNEEYVRMNFVYEREMMFSLNVELLKPFAEALKAFQSVCSTTEDNESFAKFLHLNLITYFLPDQLIALFALEPSLLKSFLHNFSYVARRPIEITHYLLQMTMIMRNGGYGSLEDLKSAFIDLKNHVCNRVNGYDHLMKLHNCIGLAKMRYCLRGKGTHPRVFDNEYTKCLDIFSLGPEDLKTFWNSN